MRHPGDPLHGAQHRRHEKVLGDTLLHPGAESVVLVVRLVRLLLLHGVRSQCRPRAPPQVTAAARLVHLGSDRAGGVDRPHRPDPGDESVEDRGRGEGVGHQVAGHHPGVRDPGVSLR